MQEQVHDQEGKEYDAGDWIRPETVADAILHVLDLPRDATIPDVTVSPGPCRGSGCSAHCARNMRMSRMVALSAPRESAATFACSGDQ